MRYIKIFLFLLLIFGHSIYASELKNKPVSASAKFKKLYREMSLKKKSGKKSITEEKIPPKFQVGDTKNFWSFNAVSSGLGQYLLEATCLAVGDHCYIFGENESIEAGLINENTAQIYLENFEIRTPAEENRGIFQIETESFCEMPDALDNDPRLYILIQDIKDNWQEEGEAFVAGFFMPLNQYSVYEVGDITNEVEMIYVDCYPAQPVEALSTLSHEFNHLLQWGCDNEEELWIEEGLSQFASRITGYALDDTIHTDSVSYYTVDFFSDYEGNPQTSLIEFRNFDTDPGGVLPDYNASYLFMIYLSELFGDEFVFDVFKDMDNGLESIEKLLHTYGSQYTLSELFHNWGIANYIDSPELGNGEWGYNSVNIGLKSTLFKSQFAVQEFPAVNSAYNLKFSNSYFRYRFIPDSELNFFVEQKDNFSVSAVKIKFFYNNYGQIVKGEVSDLKNNCYEHQIFENIEEPYQTVENGTVYSVYEEIVGIVSNTGFESGSIKVRGDFNSIVYPEDENNTKLLVYPNPVDEVIYFQLNNGSLKELIISSESGKTIVKERYDTSLFSYDVSGLNSGIYYYFLKSEGKLEKGIFSVEH